MSTLDLNGILNLVDAVGAALAANLTAYEQAKAAAADAGATTAQLADSDTKYLANYLPAPPASAPVPPATGAKP